MRILHTSDWHLGRSFHREDLLPAQAGFVDFLVETVRAESVDAVVVAGDVYDRALPSVDAVTLCNDALRRLAATGTRVVVSSGNHDSARRLGFGADLIDAAGVHVRCSPGGVGRPVLLGDEHGPVAVYALPYLEPDAVHRELAAERTHPAVVAAALDRVRLDLAVRRAAAPATRAVVLAHAFVGGGEASDSERDITVGGSSLVPLPLFHDLDYVALGHLHGAQVLADGVRYSGSPLAYSFSEEHHRKSVWLVDLGAPGSLRVERVDCPVPRPLARVRGRLDDLLTGGSWSALERSYLQVTLTDPVRPREPMEQLRSRFPHTLVLDFEPDGSSGGPRRSYTARLRGLGDLAVCEHFVDDISGRPADDDERALLRRAFEELRLAEALR